MKILIPTLGNKIAGPEVWKEMLIENLKDKHEIIQFNSLKTSEVIKGLYYVLGTDIIHSYNQSVGTILTLFLSKIFGKRIIHTVHGNYYEEQENKKGLKRIFWIPFNKLCNKLANKITFPSKYLYNEILKREPSLKEKSVVIPNGIDIKKIRKIKKYTKRKLGLKKLDFLIVEITNFNYEMKAAGINLLVKDFKKFKLKNKNSYLFIIGNGKLLEKYKQKYESDNIQFLGFKKDAIEYIKACDLFVHYSYLDSFGIVLLEAMACGKPVIAKGFSSSKEILDNSISLSTLNKKDLEKLKQQSKKRGVYYDIRNVTKKFVKVYKND